METLVLFSPTVTPILFPCPMSGWLAFFPGRKITGGLAKDIVMFAGKNTKTAANATPRIHAMAVSSRRLFLMRIHKLQNPCAYKKKQVIFFLLLCKVLSLVFYKNMLRSEDISDINNILTIFSVGAPWCPSKSFTSSRGV